MFDFLVPEALATDGAVSSAQAAAQPGFEGLLFPIALIVIFYFLLIRPQQKRNKDHKKMVAGAKKGDEIVTTGGVLGKITEVGDNFFTLEIGTNLSVQITKASIASVMPKGTYKATAKVDSKPKK